MRPAAQAPQAGKAHDQKPAGMEKTGSVATKPAGTRIGSGAGIERNVEGRDDDRKGQGSQQIAAAGAERDPAYQQQTVKCQQDATAKERFDEV